MEVFVTAYFVLMCLSILLFLDKIEYDPQFMQTKPRRLDWCELGFDYESLEHFRLSIVDRDGRVRLND